jgi:hypothetical protein
VGRSFWRAAVCMAVGLFSPACFFDHPLDAEASVRVDNAVLGTWRCLPFEAGSEDKAEALVIVVTAPTDRRYKITFHSGDDKPEKFDAYASTVSGRPVLNLRVQDPRFPLRPWLLARYSFLRPDVVHVQVVDDTKLEGADGSSETLRRAFEKIHDRPDSYGDYCICIRGREGPASAPESPSRPTRR